MTQTQASHHHILSPIEGVEGNSQTYPRVNVVEFVVDLTIPGVLSTVLNIIRNIVTEVGEWDSHVRDWVTYYYLVTLFPFILTETSAVDVKLIKVTCCFSYLTIVCMDIMHCSL